MIQRITWTSVLGINFLENLISVTWKNVFGINFAIISGWSVTTLVAWFARIDSHDSRESGDSRESEIRVIRANRPDTLQKQGFQLRMIRANRFARIAHATKVTTTWCMFGSPWHESAHESSPRELPTSPPTRADFLCSQGLLGWGSWGSRQITYVRIFPNISSVFGTASQPNINNCRDRQPA